MIKLKRSGFTLAELLIAVIINAVAIAIIIQASVYLNRDFKILLIYLNSSLKGREIIEEISRDTRMAVRVLDDYGAYTTTDDCLILKVPSVDAAGDIIDVNEEFDFIIYHIAGDDLWKVVIPGSMSARLTRNSILKKAVESVHIEYDGNPLSLVTYKSSITRIELWVSLSEKLLDKDYRIQPATTVKLMNYEWEFIR